MKKYKVTIPCFAYIEETIEAKNPQELQKIIEKKYWNSNFNPPNVEINYSDIVNLDYKEVK